MALHKLGNVPLNPDDYIKNIFVEDPPDKHIHIIIEKPAKEPPLKRARTEEEGKSIPIGWDSFSKIVNGGCTFLDKTSLISEFIECNSKVSLIVRPRRFGKTINLTMLRDFFSIPIHPDNKKYHRELFIDTKIMEKQSLFDTHFCKYPVIFLSLKNFDGCETWSKMKIKLFGMFAMLYKNHNYVYDKLDPYEKTRFSQIRSEDENCKRMDDVLVDLSRYLKDYHGKECIVLIDEYDHPLDIAYRYQYYEEAHGFFASLFGALLKSNDDNLEKALLVGVSRIAKSGYLSGLNNMQVFLMHDQEYADKFGFTEDEVSIILQHYKKSQAKKFLSPEYASHPYVTHHQMSPYSTQHPHRTPQLFFSQKKKKKTKRSENTKKRKQKNKKKEGPKRKKQKKKKRSNGKTFEIKDTRRDFSGSDHERQQLMVTPGNKHKRKKY
ncbi:DUF1703-domain-containing protein [Rhizophagus irregularis]|uniref:DUF1703-domain-containing protein n=1 Tax=Rhizophagus irregularis TaxID=588596 RepID=A0A2N1MP44_9GLOM|nr:DUF1703-domain-containing protein [Rhizophagus irregularis]